MDKEAIQIEIEWENQVAEEDEMYEIEDDDETD